MADFCYKAVAERLLKPHCNEGDNLFGSEGVSVALGWWRSSF